VVWLVVVVTTSRVPSTPPATRVFDFQGSTKAAAGPRRANAAAQGADANDLGAYRADTMRQPHRGEGVDRRRWGGAAAGASAPAKHARAAYMGAEGWPARRPGDYAGGEPRPVRARAQVPASWSTQAPRLLRMELPFEVFLCMAAYLEPVRPGMACRTAIAGGGKRDRGRSVAPRYMHAHLSTPTC